MPKFLLKILLQGQCAIKNIYTHNYGYLLDCKLLKGRDLFSSYFPILHYWLTLSLYPWTRPVPIPSTYHLCHIILVMIEDRRQVPGSISISHSISVLNYITINFSQRYCFCNYIFCLLHQQLLFLSLLDHSNQHAT